MILGALRQLAQDEGLLQDPNYEPKAVAWIIMLRENGELLGVIPTGGESGTGKKSKGKMLSIPRRVGRTSAAVPDFLVDKSEYVLAVEPDGKRPAEELRQRVSLFRSAVAGALDATGSPGLRTVLTFLDSDEQRQRAVARIRELGYRSNDLFAFQIGDQYVHDLPEVRSYLARQRGESPAGGAQCLICGERALLVDKHPSVKVPGGTTSGVALVSFNSEAFESYGLSRNENAPVCRSCAEAYTTGLNRLFAQDYPDPRHPGTSLPKRYVRLSKEATAVFWAGGLGQTLDLFVSLFEDPQPGSVEALYRSPHTGRRAVTDAERFHCLILTGGQGRATVRGMHTGTVAEVEQNLKRYFDSIQVAGADRPFSLWRLLAGLVLEGNVENLPPGLQSEMFLAILFGGKFPRTLLARAVDRCRAEQKVTAARAAVLRSYLTRSSTA